jgi:hypothetical protein
MRDASVEECHAETTGTASITSIATSTSPSTLLDIDETDANDAETTDEGNTTPPALAPSMLPHPPKVTTDQEKTQDDLAPLDPGELADTEGETPLHGPPNLNGHYHHHKNNQSRGRSGSHLPKANGNSLTESVDVLSKSEVVEAREAEGYEGDVEGNESGA